MGGVRHGVDESSTIGTLPQWYGWYAIWEYGYLAKENPLTITHPATVVANQVTPPQGMEPMVTEEAIPSPGAPTPFPKAPNPESADPEATVHGMMIHITQMVDLMLVGLLAPLCKEKGLAFQRRFTDTSPPK